MQERNFTMDKVRMFAALLVMMGHLLHIKGTSSGFLIGSFYEKIFSSGAFAVVVFFGLSGIALRIQTEKYGVNFSWLTARIIRLMPVYWITFVPPIIGCYLLGVKVSYPAYGYVVAAAGLQAVATNLAIPPVNGPLWSLSVELYLSACLLILGKSKKIAEFYILGALVLLGAIFPVNEIIKGLPIFFFGYLIARFRNSLYIGLVPRTIMILIPISILIFKPSIVQEDFSGQFHFVVWLILAILIVSWTLLSPSFEPTFFSKLSQRSYSLYAVHAPLILFIDKIIFGKEARTSVLQIVFSLLFIFMATELLYRLVEKPSIEASRIFLGRKIRIE